MHIRRNAWGEHEYRCILGRGESQKTGCKCRLMSYRVLIAVGGVWQRLQASHRVAGTPTHPLCHHTPLHWVPAQNTTARFSKYWGPAGLAEWGAGFTVVVGRVVGAQGAGLITHNPQATGSALLWLRCSMSWRLEVEPHTNPLLTASVFLNSKPLIKWESQGGDRGLVLQACISAPCCAGNHTAIRPPARTLDHTQRTRRARDPSPGLSLVSPKQIAPTCHVWLKAE